MDSGKTSKFDLKIHIQTFISENKELLEPLKKVNEELSYEEQSYKALEFVCKEQDKGLQKLDTMCTEAQVLVEQRKQEESNQQISLEELEKTIKDLGKDCEVITGQISFLNCIRLKHDQKVKERIEQITGLQDEASELRKVKEKLVYDLGLSKKDAAALKKQISICKISLADDGEKLRVAQLTFGRYHTEFLEATESIQDPKRLNVALLKMFDKHIRRGQNVKEEQVLIDINPYTKFCRERNHFRSLMDVNRNRVKELKNAFSKKYTKQTKAYSDLINRANYLRQVLQQKRDRINCLEMAVKLPADKFGCDPSETCRRLETAALELEELQNKEENEIAKRHALINQQQKELERIYALLVVPEKGRIVRVTFS